MLANCVDVGKGVSKGQCCFSRFLKSYVCVYQSFFSDRDNSCIFISNRQWNLSQKGNLLLLHDDGQMPQHSMYSCAEMLYIDGKER